MALQRLGDAGMDRLIAAMQEWSKGNPLEQRAAAAALCEPRLLGQVKHARAVLAFGVSPFTLQDTVIIVMNISELPPLTGHRRPGLVLLLTICREDSAKYCR